MRRHPACTATSFQWCGTRTERWALATGGDQKAIDWVLRMARVPAGDFLDAIATEGGLTPELLDALGDAVAGFHRRLAPATGIDAVAALRRVIHGNAQSARDAGVAEDAVQTWQTRIVGALDGIAPWLTRRERDGFVRRAHGDLHLGNLCLWQGRPVPFDALEFDEAMATIDLGYDLAFLLMDLDRRVSRAAANRVLSRYVARTGDAALTGGLPVFLSLRAMIRAHVEAKRGAADMTARYLAAASAYLQPKRPLVLAIGGLPGSGKSTLARALAPDLGNAPGALVLRSDEIRKRQHGVAPEERLPQAAYSDAASEAVFAALAALVRDHRERRTCRGCRCNLHRAAPSDDDRSSRPSRWRSVSRHLARGPAGGTRGTYRRPPARRIRRDDRGVAGGEPEQSECQRLGRNRRHRRDRRRERRPRWPPTHDVTRAPRAGGACRGVKADGDNEISPPSIYLRGLIRPGVGLLSLCSSDRDRTEGRP